jgi:hypothetical protein
LSALTAACNQKSNREPVMSLTEGQVLQGLQALERRHLVWERGGAGGRVPRYAHKLSGTLTRAYDFSREQLAVLTVLLLRGPQTPGEIRSRAPRTCEFHDLGEVEATVRSLAEAANGPFVVELDREPGRRERRYAHLFGGRVEVTPAPAKGVETDEDLAARLAALEARVDQLYAELAALREALGRQEPVSVDR